MDLRAQFPVFERVAYLNAGTCGPLPAAARTALVQLYDLAERDGRRRPWYERLGPLRGRQRAAYAALLGADPADVALTTATSDGVARVVAGLGIGPGDEVVVAEDEHPGLVGPLLAARAALTVVPLADVADAVTERTRLVACSHIGWVRGDVAPDLTGVPDGIPVLLDGAQGVGAVPVDVQALGCAFYAGSGQKWLCGPVGTGMLYVAPAWRDRLRPVGPGYTGYADGHRVYDPEALHNDARLHDAPAIAPELVAAAVAALEVLEAFGWDAVHERARTLAAELADRLRAAGRTVAARGATTLVSFEVDDTAAALERLDAAGVAVRDLPGTRFVRASVGAWTEASDLERLLAALEGV